MCPICSVKQVKQPSHQHLSNSWPIRHGPSDASCTLVCLLICHRCMVSVTAPSRCLVERPRFISDSSTAIKARAASEVVHATVPGSRYSKMEADTILIVFPTVLHIVPNVICSISYNIDKISTLCVGH